MSQVRRIISVLIIAALAVAVVIVAQDWRLFYRFFTQPADVAEPEAALWYTPRATLGEGPGSELPVAYADARVIPETALAEAWDYAESMGTDALIISHDGVIQFERYSDGVDETTLFQSQSLHKGLTAMALGAAIRSGAIADASAPASGWLNEWAGIEHAGTATLGDLAWMQSGIERPRYQPSPFSGGAKMFMTGKLESFTLSLPFVAAPGEAYIWSNASTQALSIAIERATGKPWHEFVGQAIWNPIGGGEAYVQLDHPGGTAQSFCCLITSPRNWLRVGHLLLAEGATADGDQVLPAGWVRTMTTAGTANPNYGMQLWVNEPYLTERLINGQPRITVPRGERLAAQDAFYIEGHFAQRLHVVPSSGLVVVRMGDDRTDWEDAPLMNPLIRAVQAIREASPLSPVIPGGSFETETKGAEPDYSQTSAWAAHPDKPDPADLVPQDADADTATDRVPAFYVYPTVYRYGYNADIHNNYTNLEADAVVTGQASTLNGCCDVYAPRYRQGGSVALMDQPDGFIKAFGFAFEDVRVAFDRFLEEIDGEPFVLMGHSQGAFHTRRLIEEVILPRGLQDRLVVAYIIGIPVPTALVDTAWDGISGCTDAEQTRCVASWSTFGPDADAGTYMAGIAPRFPDFVEPDGTVEIVCTNPLTGSNAPADARANLGAVAAPVPGAYLAEAVPGLVGAQCEGGMLWIDRDPGTPYESLLLPVGNYHYYDVALFYENVKADARTRVAAYLTGTAQP